jgi:hypothetical protein
VTAIFALCARLFPRVFREEFGADLVAQASSDYHRALEHGTFAGLRVGCLSVANLLGAAVAEHLRPTWNTTVVPVHQGSRMRTHLDQWRLDLAYAMRALRRSPGYGVQADDIVTFAGTAFAMVLIGLGASYLPARRASNVDPIESLRGD